MGVVQVRTKNTLLQITQSILIVIQRSIIRTGWIQPIFQLGAVINAITITVTQSRVGWHITVDLISIADAIVISIANQRLGAVQINLIAIAQTVLVAIRIIDPGFPEQLVRIRKAIAIQIIGAIVDTITIGITAGRIKAALSSFHLVIKSVTIKVLALMEYLQQQGVAGCKHLILVDTGQGKCQFIPIVDDHRLFTGVAIQSDFSISTIAAPAEAALPFTNAYLSAGDITVANTVRKADIQSEVISFQILDGIGNTDEGLRCTDLTCLGTH